MKKFLFLILIFLFGLYFIKCGEPLPNDYGGDIIDIKFSSVWYSGTGQLGTPDTSFEFGIKIVYYEITFEGPANKGGMVQKEWQLSLSPILEATSFMPKDSKRICGELHYYDESIDMDIGTYQIFVKYYEDGEYKEYDYESEVNRTFTVQ